MRQLCPGQDTRFWRPDDIFEIPCGACGAEVEFFKDDVYRRCTSCGRRVANPKFNLGCAQWCEHAKECLGYDPKAVDAELAQGETLVGRIVEILKTEYGEGSDTVSHAVRAQEYAKEIMRTEEGDPVVVLLAALLHDVGVREAQTGKGREGPPEARRILEEAGVHFTVVEDVCKSVGCEHGADAPDTPEARIAGDADRLAQLRQTAIALEPGLEDAWVEKRFHTEGGKNLARRELARNVHERAGME